MSPSATSATRLKPTSAASAWIWIDDRQADKLRHARTGGELQRRHLADRGEEGGIAFWLRRPQATIAPSSLAGRTRGARLRDPERLSEFSGQASCSACSSSNAASDPHPCVAPVRVAHAEPDMLVVVVRVGAFEAVLGKVLAHLRNVLLVGFRQFGVGVRVDHVRVEIERGQPQLLLKLAEIVRRRDRSCRRGRPR